MEILEQIIPIKKHGPRSGQKLNGFLGVTIHNTGNYNYGAGAQNHANFLKNSNAQTSWHWSVDDKQAILSLPEDEKSWNAGDGANGNGNAKTVSIEICVNPDSDLLQATNNAAEITAQILKRHNISKVRGYVFQHNDWNGKNCPAEIRKGNPYDWETFLNKVESFFDIKPEKTIDELAEEVIAGVWGNNPERKNSLEAAGYDYNAIQRRVNELLNSVKPIVTGASVIINSNAQRFVTGQTIATFAKNRVSDILSVGNGKVLVEYQGSIVGWVYNEDITVL